MQRVRKRSSALAVKTARHKIRRRPKRKTVQKLKIAWRLCYSRKPFRELCPRMRTPERGQLEAFSIGCPKQPRRFSGQLRHLFTCPRLDLLYQTVPDCARGESKKLWAVCGTTQRDELRVRKCLMPSSGMLTLRKPRSVSQPKSWWRKGGPPPGEERVAAM